MLTINTGSSSLKAAVYRLDDREGRLLSITVLRIGHVDGRVRVVDEQGNVLADRGMPVEDHAAALVTILEWLRQQHLEDGLAAVGHRIVYGGELYEPQLITPSLVEELERLIPVDPEHLPQAIAAIRTFTHLHPDLPQVACFDTAFHAGMPRVARLYALPRPLIEAGILRHGFHGLSYEYVFGELRRLDPQAMGSRVVLAHLGSGASMVAVRGGVSIDTTMGFTPTGGLVMGTRPGDLDPGVLLYLLQVRGIGPSALNHLLNQESGLLGLSGTTADMQDLLTRAPADPRAAEAVELFCYQAKKYLGGLIAVLGGLDVLVFTGGIGEHAAPVRQRICERLEALGIALDPDRNAANAPVISRPDSPVTVRIIPTDEDCVIARHVRRIIAGKE
ncbi:MAG: acetate/propionate family kinase [Chloroflexi bacterium]|nr:acetate/propionate family kinase [Chloroflexota bacterium]